MKKLIAGNWKMNGSVQENASLVSAITEGLEKQSSILSACDLLICPPAIYISELSDICERHNVSLGAQDCSIYESGAYTGEISAPMLKEIGCTYAILGHSERRQYHDESNETVAAKAKTANENGLVSIICVGETEGEREAGAAEAIVERQLLESLPETASIDNTVIAYEPVWAIGTGKTASAEDAQKMHSFIRGKLKEKLANGEKMRILYGGSMKPENAGELLSMPDIDGGLIGGASLKAEQFLAIALAASKI